MRGREHVKRAMRGRWVRQETAFPVCYRACRLQERVLRTTSDHAANDRMVEN